MNPEQTKELMKEEWRQKYYPTAQEVIDEVTEELNKKHSVNKLTEVIK